MASIGGQKSHVYAHIGKDSELEKASLSFGISLNYGCNVVAVRARGRFTRSRYSGTNLCRKMEMEFCSVS